MAHFQISFEMHWSGVTGFSLSSDSILTAAGRGASPHVPHLSPLTLLSSSTLGTLGCHHPLFLWSGQWEQLQAARAAAWPDGGERALCQALCCLLASRWTPALTYWGPPVSLLQHWSTFPSIKSSWLITISTRLFFHLSINHILWNSFHMFAW